MVTDLWYKNAIIYSLSVDSFLDSDGDGCGDFNGLIRRLDYLRGLGITAVWLMPFHPSPRRDHGYDVIDYYNVDPRFGTLGDFVAFTHACRQRGLRVMMDLVINHTSDQHPWFQAAIKDPKSRYRDFYIWSDEKPDNAAEGVVFPGYQETTWTWHPEAGAYYYHKFYHFQPDLNIANHEVREEMLKIIGFWLQLGVSGFRMDAVPFLIAADAKHAEDAEPADEFLRDIRSFAQWRNGDAVLLAEANVPPEECLTYFGKSGDRLHMMFNFAVNQTVFYALAAGDTGPLKDALASSAATPATAQWAHFLRNHDELDIGNLPGPQKQAIFDAFAPSPDMQLYERGIRRRLAPMLDNDRRRIELAYSLMMSLPGTPVLRYGDEIGMGEDLSLEERFSVRTPMQWSDERHGGFTSAAKPIRPVVSHGPCAYQRVNVAAQRSNSESMLNWMEKIIRMRKELPEIGLGNADVLPTAATVLAICYRWGNAVTLVVHNLVAEDTEVSVSADKIGATGKPMICLHTDHRCEVQSGRYVLSLPAYGYRWFKLGGLEDMIDCSQYAD